MDAHNLHHRDFRRILKRTGLRKIRIHDLRHTFASILIAAKHSPKYIQNQLEEVHEGAAKKTADVVFSGNVMVTSKEKGVTAETATP